MVGVFALVPRTSPPHMGHLFPQPAPDPVALTYAPQSTTATLQASAAQAKAAIRNVPKILMRCGRFSDREFDDETMPEDILM